MVLSLETQDNVKSSMEALNGTLTNSTVRLIGAGTGIAVGIEVGAADGTGTGTAVGGNEMVGAGTGTPVVGGLTTFQAQSIIRGLGGVNLVAMDVVEVAPAYDHAEMTSLAAASLAVDYLCLRASAKDKV